MKVYSHITQLLTLAGAHHKDGRKLLDEDLSILEDAAIVMDDNLIH